MRDVGHTNHPARRRPVTTIAPPDESDELVLSGPPTERTGRLRGRAGRELRRAMIDPAADTEGATAFVPTVNDRLALFTPMVTAVRVATTAISLLLRSFPVDQSTPDTTRSGRGDPGRAHTPTSGGCCPPRAAPAALRVALRADRRR